MTITSTGRQPAATRARNEVFMPSAPMAATRHQLETLLAALAVAGLPTDQFLFAGFLPPKATARRSRIAELGRIPATLVLFETGPRLAAALTDLAAGPVAVVPETLMWLPTRTARE